MAYSSVGAAIHYTVSIIQLFGKVIGVENSHFGGFGKSVGPHHFYIGVGNLQYSGTAVGRGRHRIEIAFEHYRMTGKEGNQMFGHADRSHAGTTSTVRYGKCFMKIEVADVGSDCRRIGNSNLGIHVGAIHIDQTAGFVNDATHFFDFRFENTVSRRIRNHKSCQIVGVFFGFFSQIVHIHIAFFVAVNHYGRIPCLNCTGRIGSVGRGRYEHYVAMFVSDAFQIACYHNQPGIFSGRTRIGLEAYARQTGNFCQHHFQFFDHFVIALCLFDRCERMYFLKTGIA